MSLLVADCPRCGASQHTFDVTAQNFIERKYGWQSWYEVFGICRNCSMSTIFRVCLDDINAKEVFDVPGGLVKYAESLNKFFRQKGYVSLRDQVQQRPPEHLSDDVKKVFQEAATCMSVECWNASGTMFRLAIDLVTKPLLPAKDSKETNAPNRNVRRGLGLRLLWLFKNGLLPKELENLAKCVKEDGNDGAHLGNLDRNDVEDLHDFTYALLERLVAEPKRLELAQSRREARRKPAEKA